MLIEIAKPERTGLYCTPQIHRPLKLNSSTLHRCWILDRRAGECRRTLRLRCGLCCNVNNGCHCGPHVMQDRSWLVRLTKRNHFQSAVWRQTSHASYFIYILDKTKCVLYAKRSLSTKIISHFHKDSLEIMLQWTDHFGQLGLTASNGFNKREMIFQSDLHVAKLSKMGKLGFRQMQKNFFYFIKLLIVYRNFRSWSSRNAIRVLHIMIRKEQCWKFGKTRWFHEAWTRTTAPIPEINLQRSLLRVYN